MADTRAVKLGRMMITKLLSAFHWAVKVGDTWYEIDAAGGKKAKRTRVSKNSGYAVDSGAGSLGGELAGETDKTDKEINEWIEMWVPNHPDYEVIANNCQKFAYELMDWLTEGNFICPHNFNAADHNESSYDEPISTKTFVRAEGGNAIARVAIGPVKKETEGGIISTTSRLVDAKVQAVAGPGLGVWADASMIKIEKSVGGVVGGHIDVNVNTGAGIRNGNVDVHLLGFGGRIGADGISLDTPVVGVSACSLM